MKTKFLIWLVLLVVLPILPAGAADRPDMVLMVLDQNAYVVDRAVEKLKQDLDRDLDVRVVTVADIAQKLDETKALTAGAPVIVVDVMGRELKQFVTDHVDATAKTVYALRGSLDDETLKKQGLIFDPEVAEYFRHLTLENVENMIRLVGARHKDGAISYGPVKPIISPGLFHPDAPALFTDVRAYLDWQNAQPNYDSGRPFVGLVFFTSFLNPGQRAPVAAAIRRLEAEGFNVLPCFGRERDIFKKFLLDGQGRSRVRLVLAWSFKFYNALTPELAERVEQLDVPLFSGISLYKNTVSQWRESPQGIDTLEVAWSVAVPELSGLIEPTVLSGKEKVLDPETGKTHFQSLPVDENFDRLIPRIKKWLVLQDKPNKDKKVAVMFYNHHQGKQNVGASYLNVFRSLSRIQGAMEKAGYCTGDLMSEAEIKDLILTSARNIGTWAPGELDRLLEGGRLVHLPRSEYLKWFEALPEDFKARVVAQWGLPEASKIMVKGDDFIIPAVEIGNLVLLPEPVRGWGDDPDKLYHSDTLYPHHQYLAAYLWLQKKFKADAMIHLGTHATYEWTPGKQVGLSPSCPPEVLITDIPNLYPYIVDDVGEAIQAKRRGRGVMISHLTPVLKQTGDYGEYSRMADLVNQYQQARAKSPALAAEKYKALMALAGPTGILKDLEAEGMTHGAGPAGNSPAADSISEAAQEEMVHLLGHYLEEIRENLMPFGMHTFGQSPDPEASREMTAAICKLNSGETPEGISKKLARSGPAELEALIRGLDGRFVPPGPGNDPVRNPGALPTGRNLYGFNPGKLPSPAAWELGKTAARQIIQDHMDKQGSWPNKVAVVLWAVETLRNEGVNESTILYLIGAKPRWSPSGRVLGVDIIPGPELGRPRIDVMINASGLYRDVFPEKLAFIDKAIRLAEAQTDVENLIARNSAAVKTRLIREGMDEKEAEKLSRFRVFSERPGAYGTGVSEMASNSAKWDDPDRVVDVFQNRMGFAFGDGAWGVPAKAGLRAQLAGVDVTVQSSSSNVYGLLDNDDFFQYLGGLSMAVRKESGKAPQTLVTRQKSAGRVGVEDAAKSLGREMRSRYLNPKWIRGMQAEDYAGAKAMADYVEYLWGWNMTNPEKVDKAKWEQTFAVYVEDKHDLNMKEFFDKASPWAFQSITGRMLETHRKGYWQAEDKVLKKLAARYAVSVVEKGVACCDHTCNNPMLNQMVMSIISIPGVLSPEMAEQFKIAVEQAAQKSLEDQVKERQELLRQLSAPAKEAAPRKTDNGAKQAEVEGFKMEKMNQADDRTQMTSSGMEWTALAGVVLIMALAAFGARKKGE
ncbi:MAG: cobaltochelatase subunit CobN [Desulfobacter sp.]|nr:MAG: cobaltochelatase subunit CobN [Desulfobacter sp.]